MALILDISKKEHLSVSLYAPGASVQSYETLTTDFATVRESSYRITDLLERSTLARASSLSALQELKKNGRILFDYLIPAKIKQGLRREKSVDLTFLIDEHLISIPWELLFDGEYFLCRRFNAGRRVKTSQSLKAQENRSVRHPLLMHVIADPQGNLAQARKEASLIRDGISRSREIVVTTKSKNIYKHYVQKNIREYDIWHYAGHSDFDADHPENSGWLLRDGKLTCEDFARLGESGHWPSLIFMNACQSAFSPNKKGDPQLERALFGLANTFLMAGGRFVIGILAKVADDSAMEMAVFFYRHLIAKQNVGSALCEARNDFVQKMGEDDLAWAGYVFYGDPSGSVFHPAKFEIVPAQDQFSGKKRQFLRRRYLLAFAVTLCCLLPVAGPYFFAWQQRKIGAQSFSMRKYGQAALHYQRALDYVSNDEAAALGLYHSYAVTEQYEEAVKVLKKIISFNRTKSMDRRAFVLNRALAQGYYALENYSEAYETFSKIADFGGQPLQERLELYEHLANSSSLAQQFEQSDQWYQKAVQLADELANSDDGLRLMLARADNIRSAGGDSLPPLSKAQELYEKVLDLTSLENHADLRVQAQIRLGQLFERNGDFSQAVTFYQSALKDWEKSGGKASTISQMLDLSMVHLNLAALLIDPQLKFKEALENLRQFDACVRQMIAALNDSGSNALSAQAYRESVTILLRRFEILLIDLAKKGYQNSDLYKEAGKIYDGLLRQ